MKEYLVANENVGKRLDAFLLQTNNNFTRSHYKNLIVNGDVTVNDKIVKSGYALKEGDRVKVNEIEPEILNTKPQDIPLDIIYQDQDFAVINKPKGMVVHPAVKNVENTLVNALLFNIKDLSGINGVLRPGIVHRLDKDTSGLLVVAKNDKAHVSLSEQIANKSCRRIYLGVVEGHFGKPEGEVTTYIERSSKNRLKMTTSTKGKIATTKYEVLSSFDKFDLVKFELKTGRTHQIRVHCEHMGHPLLGDKLYGAKNKKYYDFAQFLHAHKLILKHPSTGELMEFKCDLPPYFKEFLISKNVELK